MHALIASLASLISLAVISYNHYRIIAMVPLSTETSTAVITTIGMEVKLVTIALAIITLVFSIQYSKTGMKQFNTINRVARFLAIVAVILCFIPVHWFFLG